MQVYFDIALYDVFLLPVICLTHLTWSVESQLITEETET